ncbi:zinc finger, CCHC-type containing protein [Tanacetum coccineum]
MTTPYTLQQNGISERKNRVLKEMVNFMLSYSGLSQGFWGEAMLTDCYLLNRVSNKKNRIAPYKLWTKRKLNLNYLRVWGCRAVVRPPDPKLKTLGEKGIKCIFVGYAKHSKAFRIPNGTEDIGGSLFLERSLKRLQTSWLQIDFQKKTKVARINTIRLLIAMASIHNLIIHHMDVKTAFLNGELDEEVYMNQPQGFIIPGNENKVDLTKEFLSSRFSMKDMGEADVILGIRIKHENNGITIYQSHYIEKVLKKFSYLDCTPVSTPIDTSEKLMPNNVQYLNLSILGYTSNPGVDISKISRKWLKPGKHEHGNGRARKEPGESFLKSKGNSCVKDHVGRVITSSSPLIGQSQASKDHGYVKKAQGNEVFTLFHS